MHITQAHTPTKTASARTIKRRCTQMQAIRELVNQLESLALLRRELDYLDTCDRQKLLLEAGIVSAIGPGEALAINAGLGIPWSKLRVLRRTIVHELPKVKECIHYKCIHTLHQQKL